MNFATLVERTVPLVAELFATLATRNPLRMHFADIADKTLHELVETLAGDGISQEAIAASLGLTITGFRAKMKRLRETYGAEPALAPSGPRNLLERVFTVVEEAEAAGKRATFAHISKALRGVKEDSLRGVLTFLVRAGHLAVSGQGATKRYVVVERPAPSAATSTDAAVILFRHGPLTLGELAARLILPEAECAEHLATLRAAGRLTEAARAPGVPEYRVTGFHIPLDTPSLQTAALYDHLSAVIGAVCRKVRANQRGASLADVNGGATFSFDVYDDAEADEILGFLRDARERFERWLAATEARKAADPEHPPTRRVTVYVGQSVERLLDGAASGDPAEAP
ncbi:MAG: hypothetical protein CVU56_19340 [Deltaproteobacteria bacterium HGW-Deltaproteobacteria-14]|jgi:hypothetical protein|nr:MAG: hypothetical protein CVU56_19340 [Deltaproteobacteria bacterium HGW-Deltaproteobacteria-14]